MSDSTQLQADLEQAAAARAEHEHLLRRVETARTHLAGLTRQVDELRRRLEQESADVDELEHLSLGRIWAMLKGSHASDLERETAEREAARYTVAEAESRRQVAVREVEAIEARIRDLGDVEAPYQRAVAVKEAWITGAGHELGARLTQIAARRGELLALDKETREAREAGVAAADQLGHAAELLGSAQAWSAWDTFGGGGLLTDMMKYDKVDRAQELLRHADEALTVFSRELADLRLEAVRGVQVDQMMRTFDVWFDNIFSDMAVRSRIQDASRHVADASVQVGQALAVLDAKERDINEEMAGLAEERERLLLG
jgi:hypothetical protein